MAATNDASYDLSRARASVTSQTTIAASTATTALNGSIVTALLDGALFLSAFLLFVLEPMVAKSILPNELRETSNNQDIIIRPVLHISP